jgi:hypothetical protein
MKNSTIFREITENKVNLQLESIKELKNRAGVLLGFTVAFLGFILSSENAREIILSRWYNPLPLYLILFSLFMLLAALVVKNYCKSPDPRKLYPKFKNKGGEEIKQHLIEEYIKDFDENSKEIGSLRTIINVSILIELVAVVWLVQILIPIIKW